MDVFQLPEGELFAVKRMRSHLPQNSLVKIQGTIILYCIKGRMHFKVDSQDFDIVERDVYIALPGSIVSIEEQGDDLEYYGIVVSSEMFKEISFRFGPKFFDVIRAAKPKKVNEEQVATFMEILHRLEYLYNDRGHLYRIPIVKNTLQSMFMETYDRISRGNGNVNEDDRQLTHRESIFKQFVQLVHENYSGQRNVAFYADKMCLTPRYLSSVIGSVAHVTPKEIIDECVVTALKAMLQTTDLSLQQISDQMNFPNQSFMGRYFKKHTGEIPSVFREKNK